MKAQVLRQTLLSVLLGVLTSYLVAWAIGIQYPGTGGHIMTTVTLTATDGREVRVGLSPAFQTHATDVLLVGSPSSQAETVVLDKRVIDTAFAEQPMRWEWETQPDGSVREINKIFATLPSWLAGRKIVIPAGGHTMLAQGWPFRCVQGTRVMFPKGAFNGLIPVSKQPNIIGHRVLAYHPIWPGLAFNTLLYAAPWFVVLTGRTVGRRVIRRRRGQCPTCGYDLRGGTACPECGEGMPAVDTPAIPAQ